MSVRMKTDMICNCFGVLMKIMFHSSWCPEDNVLLLCLKVVRMSVSVHGCVPVSAAACKVQRRALETSASCWVWAAWQGYWELNFGVLQAHYTQPPSHLSSHNFPGMSKKFQVLLSKFRCLVQLRVMFMLQGRKPVLFFSRWITNCSKLFLK